MNHADIIFLTPGHSVIGPYVQCLLDTIQELNSKGLTWGFSNAYSSLVADAREVTLSGTRENLMYESRPFNGNITYNKLMWIDSDITWKPSDVIKLYESDKDVITGAYLLGDGSVTAYPKSYGPAYRIDEVLKMTEPVQIESAGFGFMCVKQGVFESLSRPWFQSVNHTMKDEKTGEEFSFPVMGEDMSWCVRVKEKGYDIWLDPTVRLTHHKQMKLTWEGIRP